MRFKKNHYNVLLISWLVSLSSVSIAAEATKQVPVEKDKEIKEATHVKREFASIGKDTISENEYLFALEKGVREKFFHGKVSRNEMEEFKTSVADKLLDQTLLYQEAQRRKLSLDKEMQDGVERRMAKFAGANKQTPSGDEKKESRESLMRKLLERDTLVKVLESQVKQVDAPTEAQKKQYYEDNKDKFTAPEEWHISLIMLKVDPSSPSQVWQDTTDFAMDLLDRLREGADFAEAAYIHSSDKSAMDGGDMGYVHIGMLAKPAQDVLNLMDLHQISEPVFLLQGVAIFRLEGIKGSKLNTYKKVQERLVALLNRQRGLDAWAKLLADLKGKVDYKVNEEVVKAAMTKVR